MDIPLHDELFEIFPLQCSTCIELLSVRSMKFNNYLLCLLCSGTKLTPQLSIHPIFGSTTLADTLNKI